VVATSRRLTPSKQRVRGFKGIGLPVAVDVIQIGFLGSRKKKGKRVSLLFLSNQQGHDFELSPLKIKVDEQEQLVKVFQCKPADDDSPTATKRGFLLLLGPSWTCGLQYTQYVF